MKNKTTNNLAQKNRNNNGPSKQSKNAVQKNKVKINNKRNNTQNNNLPKSNNTNFSQKPAALQGEKSNLNSSVVPPKKSTTPQQNNQKEAGVSKSMVPEPKTEVHIIQRPKTADGIVRHTEKKLSNNENLNSKSTKSVELKKNENNKENIAKNIKTNSQENNNNTQNNENKLMELSEDQRKEEAMSLEKVTQDMVRVLADLRNSINLMKTSVNKDSYTDVVPQLEEMCQKNEAIFHKKSIQKTNLNNNNENKNVNKQQNKSQQQLNNNNISNNKVGTNAVTHSNKSSNNNNNNNIKVSVNKIIPKSTKDSLVTRDYYNPLGVIKDEVDQAIRKRQIFSIRGNFNAVRRALLSRGWIEKYLPRLNDELRKYQNYSISELLELLRNKEIYEVCRKMIKSKLLSNHQVDLFWDHSFDAFKECSDNVKLTIINKFRRDVFSYTSKQGLCEAAKDSYWFQIPGVSSISHPRSYSLTKKGDTKGFIKDFNITAAMSLLKWIVKNSVTNECKVLSESGKVPLKVFAFAVTECYKFVKQLNHEDIDNEIEDALDYDWHEFLEYYYKTVHVGNHFRSEDGASEQDMVRKAKFLVNLLKEKWPYLEMDGIMNIWILKPTNGSRGIGIHICRTLEYVLNVVKKNPNRRYIVQKYIERPFLIHDTKFDIRQWFLISSSNPLTIWIYKMCYLRFSSETYNLRKLHESIHLTNNSVQCRYQKNVKKTIILPVYNMWDSKQFRAYLSDIGYPKAYQDTIYPGMKESITAAVLMHQDKIDKRKNCFELYGADFILTEDFKPWLLEINSNPALHSSTPVTSRMCPQVLEDVIKVVVDFERNPKANTGNFELIYKQTDVATPKLKESLNINCIPIQDDYFYNPSGQNLPNLGSTNPTNIKNFSWSDLSETLDPCCNLKNVGDTVKTTLESLIKLLKNEKLKRQKRKSQSVETSSLSCVLEKTHNGTQTAMLEQLFEDFLNARGASISDDSKLSKSSEFLSGVLFGNNIMLEEIPGVND